MGSLSRRAVLLPLVLSAALLLPSGAATWGAYGSLEPDNAYDASGAYAWTGPPGADAGRVYFNAFVAESATGSALASPNSATLGSRTMAIGPGGFYGLLGVWADCNHDGYIGLADGAMREYRAEASAAAGHPVDVLLCPVVADSPLNAGHIHNDGSWITELIPIGTYADASANPNYRRLVDPTAAMWGDNIEPRAPEGSPFSVCAQWGLSPGKGQASHTGGLLQHLDCADGRFPDQAVLVAQAADPTGQTDALGQPSALWADGGPADVNEPGTDQSCAHGEPEPCQSSNAIVYNEFDCGRPPAVNESSQTVNAPAPVGAIGTPAVVVRSPGQPSVNPSGTVPATVNETIEESPRGDCNASDDAGRDFYGLIESDGADGVMTGAKSAAQMTFGFVNDSRYPCGGIQRNVCGTPGDAGLEAAGPGDTWSPDVYYTNLQPNPGGASFHGKETRLDLDLFPADWWTFHAIVGLAGLETPGNVGTYGQEFCGGDIGRDAPDQHGWVCDPDRWYADPTTGLRDPATAGLPAVGDAFNLRDVDCYDTTLVSKHSGLDPAGQDVGARSAPLVTTPGHGCA